MCWPSEAAATWQAHRGRYPTHEPSLAHGSLCTNRLWRITYASPSNGPFGKKTARLCCGQRPVYDSECMCRRSCWSACFTAQLRPGMGWHVSLRGTLGSSHFTDHTQNLVAAAINCAPGRPTFLNVAGIWPRRRRGSSRARDIQRVRFWATSPSGGTGGYLGRTASASAQQVPAYWSWPGSSACATWETGCPLLVTYTHHVLDIPLRPRRRPHPLHCPWPVLLAYEPTSWTSTDGGVGRAPGQRR